MRGLDCNTRHPMGRVTSWEVRPSFPVSQDDVHSHGSPPWCACSPAFPGWCMLICTPTLETFHEELAAHFTKLSVTSKPGCDQRKLTPTENHICH